MWSRRARILSIGGVVTVLLLATILVQSPVPTKTVDEIIQDADEYLGQEVAVRGVVVDDSINNQTSQFIISGESYTLTIDFIDASVSNGLENNRTVYAEGVLRSEAGIYYLEASIIKTSCPSKYEEEATSDS